MDIFGGVLLGAVVCWLASLIMRTSTSAGILLDIIIGLLGAVAVIVAMGNRSTIDNVTAGYVGSVLACLVLFAARSRSRFAR